MTRISSIAAVAVVCVLAPMAVPAQVTDGGAISAARSAYETRGEPAKAKEAVELFKKAAVDDPTSYEARWEGARAAYFFGTYTRTDAPDSDKMAIFDGGITLAKEAVALSPKGVEGHFWLGVLYGVYGEAKGIFKSLSMVPLIKQEMQSCLEQDPAVEGWGRTGCSDGCTTSCRSSRGETTRSRSSTWRSRSREPPPMRSPASTSRRPTNPRV